jgi:RNA polymerase sigma-70 factor (ECF subfamily)
MTDLATLADLFEANRSYLQSVAYQMLGSASEGDDAVQESWLRLSRSDSSRIENLRGWLTTVVAHVCLDMLRARRARPGAEASEPGELPEVHNDPEQEVVLAESVGLALLVVLDRLSPTERLAFVLHDIFAMPFDQIARILERSAPAARQLASRARRRVRGAAAAAQVDLAAQREVVDAFLAAARATSKPCWPC